MTTGYAGTATSRSPRDWSREDSANAYAHGSKSSGTQTDESSWAPGSSLLGSTAGVARTRSPRDDVGMETSRESDGSDCGSAAAGHMAPGVKIANKMAIRSVKSARIAIARGNLSHLYHAQRESVNGETEHGPRSTTNLNIR